MSNDKEQVIDSYIEYLRNISRKIISKSGFENVLPEPNRVRNHYYTNFSKYINKLINDESIEIEYEDLSMFRRIAGINDYLEKDSEYKLFIGNGLIIGRIQSQRKRQFVCAPLIYCPVEIEKEDDTFVLSYNYDYIQINHDLITRIFDLDIEEFVEDDEYGLQNDFLSKFKSVELVENKYSNNYKAPLLDCKPLLLDLKENVNDFKSISISNERFEVKRIYDSNENIFDTLKFFNDAFLFTNRVPHELSTYEAINTLLKEKPFQNQLLQKLFQNILTQKKVSLDNDGETREEEILNVLKENIPLSLSDNQKSAIIKAWTNELSYIQGPPGTGKSYTIAAIMLSALFLNKKILLVSHKKAAIEVVKNMVDNILGKDSVLYIGTDSASKTKTKQYLENLLIESERNNFNILIGNRYLDSLSDEFKQIKKDLNRILNNLKKNINELSDLLNKENYYYQSHKTFRENRDIFNKNFEIKNANEYIWKTKKYNEEKYIKSIEKYSRLNSKKEKNRLEIFYIRKFIKHFISEFECDKEKLRENPIYIEELFKLNNHFSELNKIFNNFNSSKLNQHKINIKHLDEEYNNILSKYLPKYWKFLLLSKLVGHSNRIKREVVSSFKSMLYYKNTRIIQNKMKNLNYEILTDIFPLWCSELRDLGKSVIMKNEIFDLVIVDEASQVNIAEIIPAFYRAKRCCVVGDKKQLNLEATGVGFSVSKSFDKLTWSGVMTKYNNVISYEEASQRNLIVTQSSILDFVSSELDFKIPTTMLDEHYRSLPPLAHFTSKNFYEDKWKIMTENGENMDKICFKNIMVTGERDKSKRIVQSEIDYIHGFLKKLNENYDFPDLQQFKQYKKDGENFTFGILSFLSQQVNAIRDILDDKFENIKKKHDIFVATPEEFQGNERDVIIISLGLDSVNKWGKGFYENENRFNVATSRAKYFTYLTYAGLPTNIALIKKYLKNFGIDTDNINIGQDSEEISSNGTGWKLNLNNCESEFELKVYDYLKKYSVKHPSIKIYNQVNACGQKRLDFVIYDVESNITCAIEVDGKDHFMDSSRRYNEAHLSRMNILKRAGWEIINIKYYNWWDNGWLCDFVNEYFKTEICNLYNNLDNIFFNNKNNNN